MAERGNTPELVNSKAALNALADKARGHLKKSLLSWFQAAKVVAEAREIADHGTWLPWLATVGITERTAQRMIRIARTDLKPATVADLGSVRRLDEYAKLHEEVGRLADQVRQAEAEIVEKNETIDELRERVLFHEQMATGSDGAEVAVLNTLREVNRTLKARGNELEARRREIERENKALGRRLKDAA